jgi:hypothetical protein
MSNNNAYSIGQPLRGTFPFPIVLKYDPSPSNNTFQIGQVWVNKVTNVAFMMTSLSNVSGATWTQITTNGDATFDNIIVNGLADLNNVDIVGEEHILGSGLLTVDSESNFNDNVTIASPATLSATGPVSLNTGANNIEIKNTHEVADSITLQSSGQIVIESNSNNNSYPSIYIIENAGSNGKVLIQTGQGDSVSSLVIQSVVGGILLDSKKVTTINSKGGIALTSTLNTSSSINIIANAGTTENINIISSQGTDQESISLSSVAGGISLSGALGVSVKSKLYTPTAATATANVTTLIGSIQFTGFTTASTLYQLFTINLTGVTATSCIFVTVANTTAEAESAYMTSVQVKPQANLFTVLTQNVGGQALDAGSIVFVNYWVTDLLPS